MLADSRRRGQEESTGNGWEGERRLLTGLWKEGRIHEGENGGEGGGGMGRKGGGKLENDSFTGGTVDRRVDKGMGGKKEGG